MIKSAPNEKCTTKTNQNNKIPLKREISLVLDQKTCRGYVGFSNLPNQVYRKAMKKGFDFTLMVVGESGLGKSTLMDSLFNTHFELRASARCPRAIACCFR